MTATTTPIQAPQSSPALYSLGSPRANELLEAARRMHPVLAARRAAAESERCIPDATIDDFQEAGFFRVLQAREYGGYEMDPQVFFALGLEIAKTCMSSAWVLGVIGVHNWQINLFDDEAAGEVWRDDNSVLISSSYAPVGRVVPVEGGFKLSGRWSFSSGCEHCDWVFLGAVVPTEEAPFDMQNYRTFLLPRSDYRIVENWDVVGLKGTGSHDIVVDDAFVPEHRTHRMREDRGGAKFAHKPPLYRLPFMQVFARAVCTATLGATEGALEKYLEIGRSRWSGPIPMRDDPTARRIAARVKAEVECMKRTLFCNFDELMSCARDGVEADLLDRARYRYDTAVVADRCRELSSKMLKAAGSSGIRNESPLLQQHRDILSSQAHIANVSEPFEINFGGMLLGAETTDMGI
ncbi:acyl-CoA dehydrogenase family protein [Parahaliea aestuarii]|uniref:Flavin-dependent monooxygenase n=1 Tax=Parahaliea aestuarii TaxID=1852021 RepID=A0A5C8ZV35_9GAMM|nr:acyl-CoA dehydrogenase family protein [Parahaliea aestuarii]TXS91614.1 flavin-dependent monooxygenase [Parahaliea aestuarii]